MLTWLNYINDSTDNQRDDHECYGDMVMVKVRISSWDRRGLQSNVIHGSGLGEDARGPVQSKPGQGNPFLFFICFFNLFGGVYPSRIYNERPIYIGKCTKNIFIGTPSISAFIRG